MTLIKPDSESGNSQKCKLFFFFKFTDLFIDLFCKLLWVLLWRKAGQNKNSFILLCVSHRMAWRAYNSPMAVLVSGNCAYASTSHEMRTTGLNCHGRQHM